MTGKMEIKTFSKKQLTVLSWWNRESVFRDRDAIICDGAVRSGKTFCMSLSFICGAFTILQIRTLHFAERQSVL